MRRDAAVEAALAANDIALVHADSPYCVNPGVVLKDDGTPVKVFTPFFRRWSTHEVTSAVESSVSYADGMVRSADIPVFDSSALRLPAAGETATWERWESWSHDALALYKEDRNNPGVDGTSRLSAPLRFGVVHPRQLIAQLDGSAGAEVFRSELAWREFYADVLFHQPLTAWQNLQKKMDVLPIDTGDAAKAKFAMFCAAQTGYPIVDAGIRQMLATGWMHNRVRMIVASFLVKDLHVPWQWGAKFFMKHLVDGDIASNNHGWQWTAGTGTDASPYYRVFNPTTQSAKFDPTGSYLREWIPEIAGLDNASIHEPASLGLLAPEGYPAPMVDHAVERNESLARYKAVSGK
jgi:deoxyribodipyrimidine photo-lyase